MAKNKQPAAEQAQESNEATQAESTQTEGGEVQAAESTGGNGQGSAVTLPNGERRVDYIRRRYYDDGAKRGDIRREINEMLEKAGQADKKIAYQIVFASTKQKEDPRKPKAATTAPTADSTPQTEASA